MAETSLKKWNQVLSTGIANIPKNHIQVQKEKENFFVDCSRPSKNVRKKN